MNQQLWTNVNRYINQHAVKPDAILDAALAASEAAGLPAINVAPNQGKLLMLLAQLQGARAILEIGALGGYSTIWLARALPTGGRLVTLEVDARHAEVALANVARAGLADRVQLRLGPALETLPRIAAEGDGAKGQSPQGSGAKGRGPAESGPAESGAKGGGPFDLIFIDADKPSTADYFVWALALSRPGSLIIVDNVVRRGEIIHNSESISSGISSDERANVAGVRRFYELLAAEPRVSATVLQTVGAKGYDGLAIARVIS